MKSKKVAYRYNDEEEDQKVSALEDFLFGDGSAKALLATAEDGLNIAELVQAAAAAGDTELEQDGDNDVLFFEDRVGDEQQDLGADSDVEAEAGPGPSSRQLQQQEAAAGKGSKRRRAPAWCDSADRDLSINVASVSRLRKLRQSKGQTSLSGAECEAALRKQHCVLHPRTSWAAVGSAAKQQQGPQGPRQGGIFNVEESQEPDEAAAEQLLTRGAGLLLSGAAGAGHGGVIAAGAMELSRLRDANGASASDAVVQALQFHPNGQLMLTAGFDKRLKLFQVDGLRNPLVQSLFLEDCPIQHAAFAAGGSVVVAAGRRPFFYVADLDSGKLERVVAPPNLHLRTVSGAGSGSGKNAAPAKGSKRGGSTAGKGAAKGGLRSCESFAACLDPSNPLLAFLGDAGHIGLVSLSSRTPVGSLKMNGSARAAAFSSDGKTLVTAGGDGVIYTWDLRSQRCLHQQRDEGAVGCTSIAISPDNSFLATGDSSGVVNVYQRPAGLLLPVGLGGADGFSSGRFGSAPQGGPPLKSFMNLTTTIDSLAFNHDSQLLMVGSRMKRDALRLVHLPSLTVYSNWPTSKSPLNYVHCAAFSPHSGFLGIGNAKGRALLYRLHHYPQA
eukprot:gene10513-10672_t